MTDGYTNLDYPMLNEGWACPTPNNKAHYFRAGRSLCGKFMLSFSQKVAGSILDVSGDDCRACERKADAEASKVNYCLPEIGQDCGECPRCEPISRTDRSES